MLNKKFEFLFRKKSLVIDRKVDYKKTLGLIDITAIGLSCSLNGIFVMIGESVKYESGPSIAVSFIIAAIACILSGLCFCELASKVQSSGAAYSYLYVTMGEFLAFCMGWNYILQYIIAVSSDARALSQNIDSLVFNSISNFSIKYTKLNIIGLANYADFLAFFIIIITSILLMVGIKESSFVNKMINFGNLSIMFGIMVFGFYKADLKNWNLNFTDINKTSQNITKFGQGGFMPYGSQGIFESVSKCFYAFIGFDAIASTSEESKNPKKDIPNAIVLTISILSFCYITLSSVLTLVEPYYLIDEHTPFSSTFEYAYSNFSLSGINIFKLLIILNVLLSIFVSIYGEIYVVTRIISTMAHDGLLFRFLSLLSKKFQTPFYATLITAIISGLFAVLIDIMELIDLLSIGTLSAYCVVSICVVLLRFSPIERLLKDTISSESFSSDETNHESFFKELLNPSTELPNFMTKKIINIFMTSSILTMILLCAVLRLFSFYNNYTVISIIFFLLIILLIQCFVIYKQPQYKSESFQVPLIPFVSFASFCVNLYLMLTVSLEAWLILCVWMLFGVIIYFMYGCKKSHEAPKRRQKLASSGSCSTRIGLISESSSV